VTPQKPKRHKRLADPKRFGRMPTDGTAKRRKGIVDKETIALQTECLRLRTEGLTLQAIADKLRIDYTYVSKLIRRALKDRVVENVDTLRRIQHERIEQVTAIFLAKAISEEDVESAKVMLRAQERDAKLMGLDAADSMPSTQVNVNVGQEWPRIRLVLIECLRPFPDAREAVVQGLMAVGALSPVDVKPLPQG